jgi:hypothetical protein
LAGALATAPIRAVSFFGPGGAEPVGAALGGGGIAGAGLGTDCGAATAPGVAPPLPAGAGGGRDEGGGSMRLAGGGGKGVCAIGGRGGAPGGGAAGVALFGGGRDGKLIRAVSWSPLPLGGGGCPAGPGGNVMRTVSFLGSVGSAINLRKLV